ncbi:MAG TPA: ACT domain-containing protein [Candidatus Limnocylindrales bacterium]|nr:ACT domain-containing protein [Candidatus Limnocylindrales bacterium]
MATEFLIKLADRPGQLADLATALADAGVNVRAMAGLKGTVGIVVGDKDTARARRALKRAKYRATERTALEVRLKDQPGSLSKAAARFGKGRVNITSAYVLGPGRGNVTVAFGVKDARKAKKALGR